MMDVRTFKLYNAKGEELDLMSKSYFFSSPKGLGMSRNETFRQVGERFVLVSSKSDQGTIEGDLVLSPSSVYQNYNNLMGFFGNQQLRLYYSPYAGAEYYRDVRLSKIDKTEVQKEGWLLCPVSFKCLTPWYQVITVFSGNSQPSDYSWTWEVTFPTGFSTGTDMTLEFGSESYMDSPCRITIAGPVTNPRWVHYVNGNQVEEGSIAITVSSGNALVIDSINDYSIDVYSALGELVQSAYGLADFTKDRFVTIKNGRNVIRFFSDTPDPVEIKMEGRLYYESV